MYELSTEDNTCMLSIEDSIYSPNGKKPMATNRDCYFCNLYVLSTEESICILYMYLLSTEDSIMYAVLKIAIHLQRKYV